MISTKFFETIIGAVIIIFATVFTVYLFHGKANVTLDSSSYVVKATFDRVDGISPGSDVMISGISVGKVAEQKLDMTNYNAVLTLHISKDVKLPLDTSAEILSAGIMGSKYIAIVPGADSEFIKDGGDIEFTQPAISIEGIISKIAFGMDSNQQKKGQGCQDAETEVVQE